MILNKATMPGTIKYVNGDATSPIAGGIRFILQINNNEGKYGAGFSGALSKKWPQVESDYRRFYRQKANPETEKMPLGLIQTIPVQSDITVINMIAQNGIRKKDVLDYEALEKCLKQISEMARVDDASIHAPRIGTGLARGNWKKIEPLLEKYFTNHGVNVTIYNLEES